MKLSLKNWKSKKRLKILSNKFIKNFREKHWKTREIIYRKNFVLYFDFWGHPQFQLKYLIIFCWFSLFVIVVVLENWSHIEFIWVFNAQRKVLFFQIIQFDDNLNKNLFRIIFRIFNEICRFKFMNLIILYWLLTTYCFLWASIQ